MKLKHISLICLNLVVIAALSLALAYSKDFLKSDEFKNLEKDAQDAIKLVLKNREVQDFLNAYPNWRASPYADSDTQWHVDFLDADDWIGNAHTDLESKDVFDIYLIKDLSDEDYRAGKEKIENLVLNDGEMLAILGDPSTWEYDINFNKWDQAWQMNFWRGIDEIGLSFWEDNGRFHIQDIFDPKAFSEQEQKELERNQAIEIAYSADGIDDALNGVYDWRTYAESHGGTVWGVEFTSGGKLFYAVVDIESGEILEARAGE